MLQVADAGKVALVEARGSTRRLPPGSGAPITADTVFDVASLTKPTATVATAMKLVAVGALRLDAQVRTYIPELTGAGTEAIEVRHLLTHSSGFPAHLELYKRILAGENMGAAHPRDAMLRMVCDTALVYAPGSQSIYSDLGFMLLGACVERAGGDRLDHLAAAHVFDALGMTATRFVDLDASDRPTGAAATEDCPYRGVVQGEVHDQNAHAAGGIMGHAGLFSTAPDLGRFAMAMIDASGGFDRGTIDAFFAPSGVPGSTWRHGWDTPDPKPGVSHAGDRWSRDGMGHLGFTGCAIWLDPARRRYVVLLSNFIHPTVRKEDLKAFRRAVMDEVVARLDD